MRVVLAGCCGITPLGGATTRGNADGIPVGALEAVEGTGLEAVGSINILVGKYCDVRASDPVGIRLVGPVVANETTGLTVLGRALSEALPEKTGTSVPVSELVNVVPEAVITVIPDNADADSDGDEPFVLLVAVGKTPVSVIVPDPCEPEAVDAGDALLKAVSPETEPEMVEAGTNQSSELDELLPPVIEAPVWVDPNPLIEDVATILKGEEPVTPLTVPVGVVTGPVGGIPIVETDALAETTKDRLTAVSVDAGGTIETVPEVVIGGITIGRERVELATDVPVGIETRVSVGDDIGIGMMPVAVSVDDGIGTGITETVVGAEVGIGIISVPVEVSVGVKVGTIGIVAVSVGVGNGNDTTGEVSVGAEIGSVTITDVSVGAEIGRDTTTDVPVGAETGSETTTEVSVGAEIGRDTITEVPVGAETGSDMTTDVSVGAEIGSDIITDVSVGTELGTGTAEVSVDAELGTGTTVSVSVAVGMGFEAVPGGAEIGTDTAVVSVGAELDTGETGVSVGAGFGISVTEVSVGVELGMGTTVSVSVTVGNGGETVSVSVGSGEAMDDNIDAIIDDSTEGTAVGRSVDRGSTEDIGTGNTVSVS
ncbi:hypothetical protein MMC32_002220 [Xylographa parallela]|nr:hypothetical protein [Xylographa parallela]